MRISSTRLNKSHAIAILAGGQSSRMGNDKALLPWRGVSLLEYLCAVASQNTDRVLVTGREKPADWTVEETVFLRDQIPDLGPLIGLKTALAWAQKEGVQMVLLLACDMPLLSFQALRWLLEQADFAISRNGLIVRNDARLEPLFSLYNVSCLPLIEAQLAQKRRSLQALIAAGNFAFIDAPAEIAAQLKNVNTREDWARLEL